MIFAKGLFRQKALRFDLPGKIDEAFYSDIKNRITAEPQFKFETEAHLWKLYRVLLIISLATCISLILLAILIILKINIPVWLVGCLAIVFLGMRPSIYFGMMFFHFIKYRREEKKVHTGRRAFLLIAGFLFADPTLHQKLLLWWCLQQDASYLLPETPCSTCRT
jgi:hypothetical protein